MIDVTDGWAAAILVAAACGAVGGLVYELLIDRFGDSGMLERRSLVSGGGRTYRDIGFWASVIVGAVAAVGFLYFMPPETRTVTAAGSPADVTRLYDPFKLLPAALIVGTGGVSFVKAMRERLLKVVTQTELSGLQQAVRTTTSQATEALATAGRRNVADAPAPAEVTAAVAKLQLLEALVPGDGH